MWQTMLLHLCMLFRCVYTASLVYLMLNKNYRNEQGSDLSKHLYGTLVYGYN